MDEGPLQHPPGPHRGQLQSVVDITIQANTDFPRAPPSDGHWRRTGCEGRTSGPKCPAHSLTVLVDRGEREPAGLWRTDGRTTKTPTQVGTHADRASATYKRSGASTALAGTHNPVGAVPRAGTGPFPKPRALVLSMVKFGQSKPDGLGHMDTVDSDLMHHQYRLSVLQWNPVLDRRNPTNIIAAACGKFHAVIYSSRSQ